MIQPGPETDLAVAKACGFRGPQILTGPAIPDGRCFRLTPDDETKCIPPIEKAFCPSTDLNDAFLAAENVGLFERSSLDFSHVEQWRFREYRQYDGWSIFARGDTPALAICAAILKLAEKP